MINIDEWLNNYKQLVSTTFGSRVLFIGLQGSFGRGESTDSSDIDVALILDIVTVKDLNIYKTLIAKLPHRERLCGFVSGKAELSAWCKHDLFQFYHDTIPILGSLDDILPAITIEDARQAVQVGACNLYHACSHNYLHGMDVAVLASLYKYAFFILQAKHFCDCGQYAKSHTALEKAVTGDDLSVLQLSNAPSLITADKFELHTALLLAWVSDLIIKDKEGDM